MKKFEELIILINTKHPEWCNLTVRGLRDISGYSLDASRQALNEVRPNNEHPKPKQKISEKSENSRSSITPPHDNFIDDPDELLMSVAMRELNKSNPDPRWATILINCKRENISNKSEVIDQLQKLPTRNLIEILKKQSGSNLPSEL